MRIAVGGFQHETNTFAPERADFARFERQDGWPGLSRGAALFAGVKGVHIPIAGAIEGLRAAGHEPVPLLWCSATPCAHVTKDAFERIAAMIVDDLRAAMPVDGLFLDLHGAMVCEHLQDGEGELLRRVRDAVGPGLPVAVSLDLHANVTQEMVALADLIEIYRTYPHVDMADTGERTAHGLVDLVASGDRPAKAFRKTDFCIPLNWGCTLHEPAESLYGLVPGMVSSEVPWVSLAAGFHLSDIAEMGPAVLAYGHSQTGADAAAGALLQALNDRRSAFNGQVYHPVDAVDRAKDLASRSARPVVLADTQDNPGGGGSGDTTGLLRALIERGAKGAVLGLMNDPAAARACHDAGLGKRISLRLGGRLFPGDSPLDVWAVVLNLADGRFTGTGPMWGGARMNLGPMALIEVEGVRVVLASKPMQAGDQAMFRHLGIEPADMPIVALKSSVHFRADFQPIAEQILVVAAPGPVYADPATLSYRNLRPGLQVGEDR